MSNRSVTDGHGFDRATPDVRALYPSWPLAFAPELRAWANRFSLRDQASRSRYSGVDATEIRLAHGAQNPRINRVRYWRPLSGLFLFLRRVSPDREGGIIAALPSVNNLIAVGPGDPVGNPLLQPRTKINNLTAVLAGSLI